MCHETFEDLEIPDAVQVDIAYDLESARCYSLDPIVEEVDKELGIMSVDSSGYVQIFCMDEYPGIISAYRSLDDFFMID